LESSRNLHYHCVTDIKTVLTLEDCGETPPLGSDEQESSQIVPEKQCWLFEGFEVKER
jgi:hypothetical protein